MTMFGEYFKDLADPIDVLRIEVHDSDVLKSRKKVTHEVHNKCTFFVHTVQSQQDQDF